MPLEYTFTIAKPDAVRLGLVGKIISRFEARGLSLVDLRWLLPSEKLIRDTYLDKSTYGYFDDLLAYMLSGPVVAMVWQADEAVAKARQVIGEKNPLDSEAGTIRGSMAAADRIQTLVHGSRSPEEAYNEMLLWFPDRWSGTPTPARERPAAQAPKMMEWWAPDELEAVR